jgi:hypothetical protein
MRQVRPRMVRLLLWLLVLANFSVSCFGRNHSQREGIYQFRLNELFQDDCGLKSGATILWTGSLSLSGDLVRIQLDSGLLNMLLEGRYLQNVERFTLDATGVDVTGSARGSPCLFTFVQAHADATTVNERTFTGTVQAHFQSRTPACVCELSASYTAVLQ